MQEKTNNVVSIERFFFQMWLIPEQQAAIFKGVFPFSELFGGRWGTNEYNLKYDTWTVKSFERLLEWCIADSINIPNWKITLNLSHNF